jgi:hypothetical protein
LVAAAAAAAAAAVPVAPSSSHALCVACISYIDPDKVGLRVRLDEDGQDIVPERVWNARKVDAHLIKKRDSMREQALSFEGN